MYSDEVGMFLYKNSEYMELYKGEKNKYYTYLENGKEEVSDVKNEQIYEDNYGLFITKATENKTRLYKEESTGKYYILRVKYNTNTNGKPTREKEYIDILGSPLVAKIDMNRNTVLTLEMLSLGSLVTSDVRKQEYNAIILPTDLTTGDYIDIRIQLPSGQDFIVISKKIVELPIIDGMESESTIWLNLSEDEILSMSCAIVESYRINGSKLYATKYTDPGMQDAAIPTYPLSAEIVSLIKSDPNVTSTAENALIQRYTQEMVNIRNNYINSELENSSSDISGKVNESIVKTQEERKKYLQSLVNGAY